jgi:hypothetical protein
LLGADEYGLGAEDGVTAAGGSHDVNRECGRSAAGAPHGSTSGE